MKILLLPPLLLSLAVAACDRASPLQAERGADETLIAENEIAANQGVPSEATSDLYRFADMTVVEGARAGLLLTASAIRTRTHTADLPHGHVMTLWWIIFNNPENCEHGAGAMACGSSICSTVRTGRPAWSPVVCTRTEASWEAAARPASTTG